MIQTSFSSDVKKSRKYDHIHIATLEDTMGFDVSKPKRFNIPHLDLIAKNKLNGNEYPIEAKSDGHTTKNIVLEVLSKFMISKAEESNLSGFLTPKGSIKIPYSLQCQYHRKYANFIKNPPSGSSYGLAITNSNEVSDYHRISYLYHEENVLIYIRTRRMQDYIANNIDAIRPTIIITKTVEDDTWYTMSLLFSRNALFNKELEIVVGNKIHIPVNRLKNNVS